MNDNVTQEHLTAIGEALPDQLDDMELLSLVVCILKGYGCSNEDVVKVGQLLARFSEAMEQENTDAS